YVKFTNGTVVYSENIFSDASVVTYLFDFENSEHANNYGSSADNYTFSEEHINVLSGLMYEFNMKRVARNSGGGLSNALVISPRVNQGDSESYVEVSINDSISKIEFDIAYWSSTAIQYFTTLKLQTKSG